jgi:hypothetical protein
MRQNEAAIPERIPTPSFRKVNNPIAKNRPTLKGQRTKINIQNEVVDDESVHARHRPLENAEKKERRREEELMRYEAYIAKLRRDYPELFK